MDIIEGVMINVGDIVEYGLLLDSFGNNTGAMFVQPTKVDHGRGSRQPIQSKKNVPNTRSASAHRRQNNREMILQPQNKTERDFHQHFDLAKIKSGASPNQGASRNQGNKQIEIEHSNNNPVVMSPAEPRLFQGKKHLHKSSNDAKVRAPMVSMTGTVVKLVGDCKGSIRTFVNLPEDYAQNHPVHFKPWFVKSGGLSVKIGDTVEFSLGTKDKSWPMALSVRLTRATSRTPSEIEVLIKVIKENLMNGTDGTRRESVRKTADKDNDTKETQGRIDWLLDILTCNAMWGAIGNCIELSFQTMTSIIDLLLLVELESKSMHNHFEHIINTFAKTRLFDGNIGKLRFYIEDIVLHERLEDIRKVRRILLMVLQHAPEKTHSVVSLIKLMVSKDKDSVEHFLLTAMKEIAKQNCDELDDVEWCDLPLVPTAIELLGGYQEYFSNLHPVLEKGSYKSSAEYLDIYFRLLRADCFGSLCKYIQELLLDKLDHRNMNVYHSVRIVGVAVTSTDSGIAIRLEVSPCMPVKNWATTSKLMFGNLVCISPSGSFKDPIWATIVNRDLEMLKHRHVDVELCSLHNRHTDAELIILMSQAGSSMVVVESPTYYLAYKPVLKSLQDIEPEQLPFQEELIRCKESKQYPAYIRKHMESLVTLDGDHITLPDFYRSISSNWPKTLDKYQDEALRNVFLRQVASIQGPPGTGKTFIGLVIIRTILAMEQRPEGPILVLTYKNHALDEFLKELLQYFPNEVVRVGGRSKDDELAKCNLKELKAKIQKGKSLYVSLVEKRNQIESMIPEVKSAAMSVNRSLILSAATLIYFLARNQLIGMLSGCDWSTCGGRWKNPEKLASKLAQSKVSAEDFFFSDETRMSQLNFALNAWKPNASVQQSAERKHLSALQVTLSAPSNNPSSAIAQDRQAEELIQDEKDIEDMQEERLAAVGGWYIKANDVVEFRNTKVSSTFFRDLGEGGVKSVHQFRQICDVWSLTAEKRLKLIHCLLLQQVEEPARKFEDNLLYYQQLCAEKKEFDDLHKISVLKSMKVIGMTITGASINAHLLASVRPAIVVIEEAAEVLEPQIVATLGSWVQHLIMIGDHKQLRPPVENYELTTQFHFDISMMERLINNDVPYNSLAIQNRMRPEFSALLLDIYPELQNSAKVRLNMPAVCVEKSMFFWHHTDQEQYSRSYSNNKEADRAVKLALFLIQQGCSLQQITILAAYQGQVALIRQKLESAKTTWSKLFALSAEQHKVTNDKLLDVMRGKIQKVSTTESAEAEKKKNTIKVHTIDMYQGDENDFVIVSLVRSNPRNAIGFLKLLNRRCVAQSRARCGLYFVGDSVTLSCNADWVCLIEGMRKSDCLGTSICLKCPVHLSSTVLATTAEDITLGSFCTITCDRALAGCDTHRCKKPCQPPHGHARCDESVAFEFSRCGHPAIKLCYQDKKTVECKFDCKEKMECKKHVCTKKCNPEHPHHYCIEKVDFICTECANKNVKMCSQTVEEIRCDGKITYQRTDCIHIATRSCHETDAAKCKENCVKMLPSCGHPCSLQCWDVCNLNPNACKECIGLKKIEQEKQRKIFEEARKVKIAELKKEYEGLQKCLVKDDVVEVALTAEGDTAVEYCKVHDMVMNYIKPEHKWFPKITSISKVCNPKLREAYLKCRLSLYDPSVEELKFHGTSTDAVKGICTNGFRLPNDPGMYGKGIYFATDSSKSAQERYTKGSHTLLLCQVGIGRSQVVKTAQRELELKMLMLLKYDSVFAKRGTRVSGGVQYDEFIVYRAKQAIPQYIIYYDIVDPTA